MSVLPSELAQALTERAGPIRDAVRLSGGMVASSAMVVTETGRLFVKWKTDAPSGFFRLEADGLDRLRAAGVLRIPHCIAWQDDDSDEAESTFPYLALEYIEPRRPYNPLSFNIKLGEGLAALHRNRPSFEGFGLETDNFLGSQIQRNAPLAYWPKFYRERRLMPQIERARRQGLIPSHRERLLVLLLDRLDFLYSGHDPEPSLIHGDLWSGNLLGAGDEPVLIDPAVYYADREMEIAYMQLFSGFAGDVYAAYESAYPLDAGYEERRSLHQLYPLLIHLNHFGEQYGPSIDAVCRHFVGV